MKRQDDFEQRRKHIANLSDKELYDRFWELTAQVVDPLPVSYTHLDVYKRQVYTNPQRRLSRGREER